MGKKQAAIVSILLVALVGGFGFTWTYRDKLVSKLGLGDSEETLA